MTTEWILAAAIRSDSGRSFWLPAPARHNDVIDHMVEHHGFKTVPSSFEQGFMSAWGMFGGGFVSREAALQIAIEAGQLLPGKEGGCLKLYSEDVW